MNETEPTPSASVDVRARQRLARQLLAEHRGWDRPPALGLVFEGPTTFGAALVAAEIPVPREVWESAHPIKVVLGVGHSLALTPEGSEIARLAPGGCHFAGCWLIVESWQAPEEQAEEIQRRKAAGGKVPRFADLVGSLECKEVMITDRAGVITWLHQQRGRDRGEPRTFTEDAGATMGGPLADALRDMTRHVLRLGIDPESRD
jgi:hypothetical protein